MNDDYDTERQAAALETLMTKRTRPLPPKLVTISTPTHSDSLHAGASLYFRAAQAHKRALADFEIPLPPGPWSVPASAASCQTRAIVGTVPKLSNENN
jgi:hypothetical protein